MPKKIFTLEKWGFRKAFVPEKPSTSKMRVLRILSVPSNSFTVVENCATLKGSCDWKNSPSGGCGAIKVLASIITKIQHELSFR